MAAILVNLRNYKYWLRQTWLKVRNTAHSALVALDVWSVVQIALGVYLGLLAWSMSG